MPTYIRDSDFPHPNFLNDMECISSSRHLNRVDESVTVLRCCIDPNDTNLVIIDFSLVGAFLFTPYCKILKVDDEEYEEDNILAPMIFSHPSSSPSVIDTNCRVYHGQLVCDFSAVIPEFLSATIIEFQVGMVGSVPQSFGVPYLGQTPTYNFIWNKGILVRPIALVYNEGNIALQFLFDGNSDCACNVQCSNFSGVTHEIIMCPDKEQEILIQQGNLDGSPQRILIRFQDSIGNSTELNIQGLIDVLVDSPVVTKNDDPKHVSVSINKRATNGEELQDVEYQVLKYDGSEQNYYIWKDWCHIDWNTFIDYDVIPGTVYGYAVRYKGKYNDITNLSSWATTTV